ASFGSLLHLLRRPRKSPLGYASQNPQVKSGGLRYTVLSLSRVFLSRGNSRPISHLYPSDECVAAILAAEDRSFPFLHVEPILAESINDVWLVGDQNSVRPGIRLDCKHLAESVGAAVVFVRRHDEPAFREIHRFLNILEARKYRGLVGAVELARIDAA